ncbi:MAG TPA: hypothetical protein VF215_17685, partial [Thermoanaerobaculia bacterium]
MLASRDEIVGTLTRPYPVTIPMVLLVSLVPLYLFLPDLSPSDSVYTPALSLDRRIPLQPVWSLIYGALYGFL